ncbi:MAG: OFA family MFS transporter [Methanomicrobiaceae archaeon]|nr:OFA family MFS transporter [Methanomicrobiaceae archaeon]
MENVTLFKLPAEKGRWVLVALGLLINLCLGSIYSWSVFVNPLTDYFTNTLGQTVSANEILMPFSVFLACFAITMPLAGKYVEEWGPRNTTIVGGMLTGTGWILASMTDSVGMLYIVYGIIGGIGVGIAYGVPVAVAARWFPDRRGLAVGLAVLGFGFSAFLTANVADLLIKGFGVMNTFRIFGIAFIFLIVLFALPLRFPPAGWNPPGFTPPSGTDGEYCEYTRDRMLKTKSFYGLWICYFIGCTAGLMAISIAKPVGTEVAGVAPALGTMLVGFFAIFNGGGRPVFGSLSDRLSPSNAAIMSFVLIAAASFAMWFAPSVPVYIISFALLWGCLGGWLAIAPAATGRFFGTCDYPRCYGVVFLAYGAGAMAGPQIAGFIRTTTGGYVDVFPFVAVLALIGILVAFKFMKNPKSANKSEN